MLVKSYKLTDDYYEKNAREAKALIKELNIGAIDDYDDNLIKLESYDCSYRYKLNDNVFTAVFFRPLNLFNEDFLKPWQLNFYLEWGKLHYIGEIPEDKFCSLSGKTWREIHELAISEGYIIIPHDDKIGDY